MEVREKMKIDFVIGVLGGMGTYATIHLFEQYAQVFSAEKEWDRPRIIIDNRCTMPSRVRAFLYHEKVDELVQEMTNSMSYLKKAGCTKIILACNTSHLFLPQIYQKVPELEQSVVHIIQTCVTQIESDGVENTYLLGSEGTIESGIYQQALEQKNVSCIVPQTNEYAMLRECIEAVKQHLPLDSVKDIFLSLVNKYENCILGCTELPILYEAFKSEIKCKRIYDPLLITMRSLKKEYENE